MIRQAIADTIPLESRYFLFRSCVASNKYPGIEMATKLLFQLLDIELMESDDQTCCGGFIAFTSLTRLEASLPAVARNLSIAEELGLHTLTMCNGCYTFLVELSRILDHVPDAKAGVNMLLSSIHRKYEGTTKILHLLEMMDCLKKQIGTKLVNPLHGMKFATHYGCHYLNGFKHTAIDDAFQPSLIEEIILELGGEVVDYPEARTCCGTGLMQVIIHKKELSLPHTQHKLEALKESQADAVVVVCPYCLSQLDRMQLKFNLQGTGKYRLPVIYITQLIAYALGIPLEKLGFGAHCIPCESCFEKCR